MAKLPSPVVRAMARGGLKHVAGAPVPLSWRRAYLEGIARRLPLPADVTVRRTSLDGIPSIRVQPRSGTSALHVLHFHGGGFVAGSPRFSLSFAGHLALACGCTVELPDYRKAPEHPYPAAPKDAWTAYRALTESDIRPGRLVLAGDSAGAALALSVALKVRDRELPPPPAVVLLSPWIDLDAPRPDDRLRAADPVLSARATRRIARLYASPEQRHGASPARASLVGLPHLIVRCGERETLRPQVQEFVSRARAAAVPVTYQVLPKAWHDIHIFAAVATEAHRAVEELAATLIETTAATEP
ncbi:alpha/beta hydrolase [Actinomadura gamaensis]|uniref:Alpha/beta hydrolase n=1 Tax=Actinomadura gamaensis TaxID=1763541 RepID=A0ABV9UBS9_9ACTN